MYSRDPARLLARAQQLGFLSAERAAELRERLQVAGPGGPELALRDALLGLGLSLAQLAQLHGPDTTDGQSLAYTEVTSVVPTQVVDPEQAPRLGGRYEICEPLGEGGMGKVWLAVDHQLKREVAIKSVRHDRNLMAEFIDEAQITGQLQHPNIVPIHELCFDEQGRPNLVMKRVKGQSLWELLDGLRGSEARPRDDAAPAGLRLDGDVLQQLLQIFLKVCDAVSYAHARGVLHRDLKPENIMLGEFGEVLVMDWGLAKARPGEASQAEQGIASDGRRAETRYGTIKGTLSYMAPEQAAGKTDLIDQRSDVFSLGAILYRLLTLQAPYEGSADERLSAVLEGRLIPPTVRAPQRQVPSELEAVVLKAMHREPASRYQTVAQLKADVETFLAGGLVAAHRYTNLQRMGRWLARHRSWLVSLTGLVLLALGTWWMVERTWRLAHQEVESQQQRELEQQLAVRLAELGKLDAELVALEAGLESEPDSVILGCERFARQHEGSLELLGADPLLAEHRPNARALAAELLGRALALRGRGLQQAAARELAILQDPRLAPELRARRAEEGFQRFLAHQGDAGLAAELPVADFASLRARLALEAGDEATASSWVARAFTAQPQAQASGEAFLLLAAASMRDVATLATAVIQYHRALSAFGDAGSSLRSEAMLGLARACAHYGSFSSHTPFAVDVPPLEMALRCLMRLAGPSGQVSSNVLATLPEGRRDSFRREVEDLLYVLRRVSLPAFEVHHAPLDCDGDGRAELAMRWDALTRSLCIAHVDPPSRPGWAPLQARPAASVELGPLLDSRGIAQVQGWQPIELEAGRQGYALYCDQTRLLVFPDFDARVPILDAVVPADKGQLLVQDLDGDGRRDLLLPSGYQSGTLWAWFQEAGGGFAEAQPVRQGHADDPAEHQLELSVPGSAVDDVLWADLDGDGQGELVLTLGIWNHFSVEVWHVQADRSFKMQCFLRTGLSRSALLADAPGGPRLGTQSYLDAASRRFFEIRHEDEPPLGYGELVYEAGRLRRVDRTFIEPPSGPTAFRWQRPPGLDPPIQLYHAWGTGTTFYTPARLGPVWLPGRFLTFDTLTGFWKIDGPSDGAPVFRYLDDADLLAIGQDAVPLERRLGETPDAHAVCAFLGRFGLHEEAAVAARTALARPDLDAAQRLRLQQVILRSLAAEEHNAALWDELGQLEPHNELVALLVALLEPLAWQTGRWSDAGALARRWELAEGLDQAGRELLQRLAREAERTAELLGTPAVDWHRGRVRGRGETAERALQDVLVSSGGAFADWQAGSFACGTPSGGLGFSENPRRLEQRQLRDAFGGVPVRFGGGPWRIVADVRILAQPWSSELGVGLVDPWALRTGPAQLVCGVRARCMGANDIHDLYLRSLPGLERFEGHPNDPSVGRCLRLEVEHIPARQRLRVVFADRDSAEVLGMFCDERVDFRLRAGLYLLGVGGTGVAGAGAFELERLVLFGDAVPVPPDDAELQRLLASFPGLELGSLLARARLRRDPEMAAAALQKLEAILEGVRSDGTPGPVLARLEELRRRAFLEAACCAADNVAELAAALASCLVADEDLVALGDWLLELPPFSPRSVLLWEAAGRALRPRLFPGIPPAELAAGFEDSFAQIPPGQVLLDFPPSLAAVACALAGELDASARLRWLGLEALLRALEAEGDLNRSQQLGMAFLARMEQRAPAGEVPALLRTAQAELLLGTLRRLEGLALLDPELPAARRHSDLHAQRLANVAREAAVARQRGVRFPELP